MTPNILFNKKGLDKQLCAYRPWVMDGVTKMSNLQGIDSKG